MRVRSKTADNMGKAPIVCPRVMNIPELGRMAKFQEMALRNFLMDQSTRVVFPMANPKVAALLSIQTVALILELGLMAK